MATEQGLWDLSYTAGASFASNQFYIVKSTAADTVTLCTGSSGGINGPRGVILNDPLSGESAVVRRLGRTKLNAGGVIAVGAQVTSTTGGQGLAATSTGEWCIGRANTASTAAGQVIEVDLLGGWFYTAGATG